MKKVLILVVSSQYKPYKEMINTALETWDSIAIENIETIFYCGRPLKLNQNKIVYFDIEESYANMGYKMLMAFEWALQNKEFDYIARVNSSCYVNKKELLLHCQTLLSDGVFSGLTVLPNNNSEKWLWGGGQFIISKDIVQLFIQNKNLFDHSLMEDVAISFLANKLHIPYTEGKCASIDKIEKTKTWSLLSYGGGESKIFTSFDEIKDVKHHFYRVKHDLDRNIDLYVMKELFKILNK